MNKFLPCFLSILYGSYIGDLSSDVLQTENDSLVYGIWQVPILILQLLFVIESQLSNSASTGLIAFLCISATAAMYGETMGIELEHVK